MRNAICTFLCVIVALAVFSGCRDNSQAQNPQLSSQQSVSETAKNDSNVYHIKTLCDWARASENLQTLFSNSDFVARVKVQSIESFALEKGAGIRTNFIPQIITSFKGNYDGSPIESLGGTVSYAEYCKKDPDFLTKKSFDSSPEAKVDPSEVEQMVEGIYLVHPGDEFIVFCTKVQDGYIITNSYEGLFKIVGNKIENAALQENPKLTADISNAISAKSKSAEGSIVSGVDLENFRNIVSKLNH